jgi:hypothetical protein
MQTFYFACTALAVTSIYIVWQRYFEARVRHERTMQDRVTYMLWMTACQIH